MRSGEREILGQVYWGRGTSTEALITNVEETKDRYSGRPWGTFVVWVSDGGVQPTRVSYQNRTQLTCLRDKLFSD